MRRNSAAQTKWRSFLLTEKGNRRIRTFLEPVDPAGGEVCPVGFGLEGESTVVTRSLRLPILTFAVSIFAGAALAAIAPQDPGRFGPLVIHDAVAGLGVAAETPESIPDFSEGRVAWSGFRSAVGGTWDVRIDRRSAAPLLVQGTGQRWFDPEGPSPALSQLEARARAFVAEHGATFRVRGSELVFDAEASGMVDRDRGVIVFRRVVEGVPVEGQRFVLHVVRGNLVSFGTDRWGGIERLPEARYGVETTRELLYGYMGLGSRDTVEELESGTLVLVGAPPAEAPDAVRWTGPVGRGIGFRLARRFVVRVSGERGTWVGKVDAVTGDVIAFYDDDKYAQVKGGIYPVASDGDCAKGGCERDAFPMPYAELTVNGGPTTANDAGIFECTGGNAVTALVGPYVRINDNCGAVNESVACDEDLDLMSGPAGLTNCSVNAGESAGNTHASRTGFYTVNRIKEKGRAWLPSNAWLANQVRVNVNVNSTCNASWNGQLNMYRAGNGCRNTAETAGVLNHEFGHGFDQNDGGGYDNPSEGYADAVAILSDRASCVGRGFYESGTCSGYGDACLACTGIRDMDWDARVSHTPATPANFIQPRCGSGGGACGREVHCEAYPPGEAVYDLAARDLPAAGLDPSSAWQLAERLFYKSRQGSGGNIYNCALPNSDGCNANGWYNTMRVADDDDGNLSNGTPHAAAIFAAFNRHAIACGAAGDASNQSSSSCPALAAPVATALNGSESVSLSWAAVPNAQSYRILRTEVSCDFTQNVIATVAAPGTSYVDADLPNGLTFYYRIQAIGANAACESPVSTCVQGTPQPFAGTVKLNQASYACAGTIRITVTDANIGAPSTTVAIRSTTETAPETVVLTETAPGSSKYVATIQTTGGASAQGDGTLGIADGDVITVQYVDADDGQGGSNLLRETTALGDCRAPQISQIQATGISDVVATIQWTTDENSTSVVHWGPAAPPGSLKSVAGLTSAHAVPLTGLSSCTVYYYSVESADAPGNTSGDDRAGQFYSFETLGDFGEGLQACRAGKISLLDPISSCSDIVEIKLGDLDLNESPTVAETVQVEVTSSTETTPEVVTLVETGLDTSIFRGSIATGPGSPVAGDGVLQAANGDLLTATYRDASAGTGIGAVSFDTGVADCVGPVFSNVRVTDVTDYNAIVRWSTSEPGSSRVDWGSTPALGNTSQSATLTTSHQLTIGPFNECGRVYFRATSTDVYGNTRVYDNLGAPFEFNAYIIPGLYRDNFETATGWTLPGEWQIDAPQGKGTAPGDPTTAFTPTKVLGLDLTGLGAKPGDYEANSNTRAESPVINASAIVGGKLLFRRWLNVGGGGIASVEVKKNGTWFSVWSSDSVVGVADNAWSLQSVDISAHADANASLQVGFRIQAGFSQSATRAGWNVDRLVVKGSSQPDFDVCGGCGGAPTFAGLVSVADVNACSDSGVSLAWAASPGWGTGHQGTYAVYRDTNSSFTPAPANRIAAGITGTSYTDLGAPNDTNLYYVVRAENDETCSTGPNNGGVTDPNLVRLPARDDTSQPSPGTVGSSLAADPVNEAHVRLTWAPSSTAAKYRVYRSQFKEGPFYQVAELTGTLWDDRDQMGDSANRYYRIRTVDACGNEGP